MEVWNEVVWLNEGLESLVPREEKREWDVQEKATVLDSYFSTRFTHAVSQKAMGISLRMQETIS